MSDDKLPRFEFVKLGNEIDDFLESIAITGKISLVKIDDKEYFVYVEKVES